MFGQSKTNEQRRYHFRGYKGPRVLSNQAGWFLRNGALSRRALRGGFYQPHQGARECARRVRQRINGTHGL